MRRTIFKLIFIAVLTVIAMYLATSLFSITELIYPVKVDSVYLRAQQLQYEKEFADGKAKPGKIFLYNPSQLNLLSVDFFVKTFDSLILKGWYVSDSTIKTGTALILITDVQESKLNYIEVASEFVARGIHVCMIDMRAQGESEGTFYTMGKITTRDISGIIDSLISKYKTENIAMLGTGTGAAIALQAACFEKRIKILMLQNPFISLNEYLASYAEKKYGRFSKFLYARMKKDYEREAGFSADSLNLSKLVEEVEIPTLFVSAISENQLDYRPTEKLFDVSVATKKEWIVFINQDENERGLEERKKYYDKIAAFINSNILKKKKSKFRKLVLK